jgi:hypothetical protein
MIKPKLTYNKEYDGWFCKDEHNVAFGDTPEQAYRKWRVHHDRENFLRTSDIKTIWPWYKYV